MSEKKQNKTKTTKKWDNLQKIGFWGIIIVQIAFWGGVYMGNTSAHQGFKEIEEAKTSAVENYKSTLKQDK